MLTQSVPARADRTVTFPCSYTFTDDDAIGKVSFRVVATIAGNRDALPLDNDIVSTPTTVSAR